MFYVDWDIGPCNSLKNSNQRKHHNKSLFSFFFQTVVRASDWEYGFF